VQALGRLDLDPLPIGSSRRCWNRRQGWWSAARRTHALGGEPDRRKQEFAGYWEYLLDEAIFTHPAHPNWGGTGLISGSGELIGIGSLQLERERGGKPKHVNMIVPIDLLKPCSNDLKKFGPRHSRRGHGLGCIRPRSTTASWWSGNATKGPARNAPNSRPAT